MVEIKFREYGKEPYKVVLVHGGPGAPGSLGLLAEELSKNFNIFEPMQSALTVDGQVEELRDLLQNNVSFPVILIGWSWGAWLVCLFAAKYPELVKKIILVSSGCFESKYVEGLEDRRRSRLSKEENNELDDLFVKFQDPDFENKDELFNRFGELFTISDSYSPIEIESNIEKFGAQFDVYNSVWKEAADLRSSGELMKIIEKIKCPVVAFHGDYDPSPAEGVRIPLEKVLDDFKFILLKDCGHDPWIEEFARDNFIKLLSEELL